MQLWVVDDDDDIDGDDDNIKIIYSMLHTFLFVSKSWIVFP